MDAVFDEYSTIYLALMYVTFLIPIIRDTDSFSGFLKNSNLELPSTTIIVGQWSNDHFQRF